ncbi:MAG: hypothetical protein JWO68_803 [Actinomycetia bacterium]|nr:hypothetical protein [Actinomycetes bacterium]
MGVAAAVVVGAVAGVAITSALGPDPTTPELAVVRPAAVRTVPVPQGGLLLAWVPGGLPAGFAGRLAASGLTSVSTVLGDTLQLAGSADEAGRVVDHPRPGFTIPFEAIAVDCSTWAPLVPVAEAEAVCRLEPDEVLLGTTSARLRHLGAGATLTLADGRGLRVAGVIADEAIGAAEVAVPMASAAAAGVHTPRYVLAAYEGDGSDAEARIRAAAPGVDMRVRGPGQTPWLRHGDAVLPQSILKEQLGEFSATAGRGGMLTLDPAWTAAHLVTVDLPVLGRVTCNRVIVAALRGALEEIGARHLLGPVDRRAAGCWNPRTIAGTVEPSRHAWGGAVDIVPFDDDPEVIDVFERWGFTWGGRWVSPDPVHFEYVRPPKV